MSIIFPGALHFRATATPQNTVQYSGLFLPATHFLTDYPIPGGWTRYAHHCTIQHQNDGPIVPLPKREGTLGVLDIRQTPDVVFARVQPPEALLQELTQRNIPMAPWHITIATAPGVKPFKAKELTRLRLGEVLESFAPPKPIPFQSGYCLKDKSIIRSL